MQDYLPFVKPGYEVGVKIQLQNRTRGRQGGGGRGDEKKVLGPGIHRVPGPGRHPTICFLALINRKTLLGPM